PDGRVDTVPSPVAPAPICTPIVTGDGANDAVSAASALGVIVHAVFVAPPLSQPLHPVKSEPAAGVAASDTTSPAVVESWHVAAATPPTLVPGVGAASAHTVRPPLDTEPPPPVAARRSVTITVTCFCV